MAAQPLVALTIDTEPDNQWRDHRTETIESIRYLGRFSEFCVRHGIRPTFLVTYGVAKDPSSMETLVKIAEETNGEIGTHLHAWDNPPYYDTNLDKDYPIFAHDLALDHYKAKMELLTETISKYALKPTSYRGGRFGFCAEHIKILEYLGYTVDSSVTSLVSRQDKIGLPKKLGGKGGRDYRNAPYKPYHPDYKDENKVGSAKLLEIPVTTDILYHLPEKLLYTAVQLPGFIKRILRKTSIIKPISASFPSSHQITDLLRMLKTSIQRGNTCITGVLHSPQLMPGGGLLAEDEAAVDRHYLQLEATMTYLRDHANARFVTLRDAKAILTEGN